MIGASPRRKEDRRLLVGVGRFVDDLRREALLHLAVVRSVEAHARIAKIALAEARALRGVVAAWSAADLPETARPMPSAYGAVRKGRPWSQPILARDRVRYVGEPVAVVVAESPYRVADALELVRVEYEPLPALTTVEAALASPTRLHDGWPDNAALAVGAAIGDAERALATADLVIHETFRHPRLAAVPIEPRGVLAYRDRDSGALVVWSSCQNPYSVRDIVAAALELPAEAVRVVVPDVGGAFGPKGSVYPEEILVAAAALRLGRPVKWIETRREDFASLGHDREQTHEARIGFARDGTIVAVDDRFLADVGAYPAQGDGLTANTVNHLPGPYRVPHYRNAGTSVVTNKALNAAYRAAGRPEAVFVMERLMDLGARRLGLDPAEIRRRNLVRPDEMPYRPGLTYKDGVPIAYDPGDFPRAFEREIARIVGDRDAVLVREARPVRHLVGAHEVAPADLGGIEAEAARAEIHEPLHHEHRLGTAGGAVRRVQRLVGDDARPGVPVVRDAVGPRQVVDRVRREPVALGRVGADVGEKPVVDRDDRAVAGEADTRLVGLLAVVAEAREVLASRLDPLHRPSEPQRRRRDQDLLGIDGPFRAERAADVGHDHANGLGGELERGGDDVADAVRVLAR